MVTLLWLSALGGPAEASDDLGETVVIPAPYAAPDDEAFVSALAAHHRHALSMANEVIARGASPEVVALARRIHEAQSREIARLEQIRAELGRESILVLEHDPHLQADLATLASATGPDLDRAFLEHMIPHHADALVMAHYALPQLQHPGAREVAAETSDGQAREIGEMRALLRDLRSDEPRS